MSKILVLITLVSALCGCNTIQGMGKDIESAGEAVQKSSK